MASKGLNIYHDSQNTYLNITIKFIWRRTKKKEQEKTNQNKNPQTNQDRRCVSIIRNWNDFQEYPYIDKSPNLAVLSLKPQQ